MFNNIQKANEQKDYIIYILQKADNLLSIEQIIEFIDITRLKEFWSIR